MQLFLQSNLFPLLAALLAALACGLLGNFLVLRRLSLMGDAISHAVLPGLVVAFLLVGSRSSIPMLAGAAAAALLSVVIIELVRRLGRLEPGAAMGVVFSAMFAIGVLLIETRAARQIDLDADCVLYGQLETLVWWSAPASLTELTPGGFLAELPRQIVTLAITLGLAAATVAILFKELRLAAFDPGLATSQGFSAALLHYLLMVLVAAATVASFEAVGSILVIAMLICPAAAARLLTDRLGSQIAVSLVIAAAAAVGGYASAQLPAVVGKEAVSAAGMITVVAGTIVVGAAIAGPRHGLIARARAGAAIRRTTQDDDLLAALYRAEEDGQAPSPRSERAPQQASAARLRRAGLIEERDGRLLLTPAGCAAATELVRRHRLWETYLVDRAGLAPDHVHDTAERLEHLRTAPPPGAHTDPHGRTIPDPADHNP
ncbi:MAG: metal ABC transporter permease [Phycisphaerales bacterium]